MVKAAYPPATGHWSATLAVVKAIFASQMRGLKLVIDADHRFDEVLDQATMSTLFRQCGRQCRSTKKCRFYENMPGSDVKTIVVDSLTAIITPLTIQAMIDRDKGRERNLMAGFKNKALAMRRLQDAVTRWGTDVLWIYHHMDAVTQKPEITRSTVSDRNCTPTRSINMQLEVVTDGNRHGLKLHGPVVAGVGITIWDDSGCWKNMPERIEKEAYDGLSKSEQDEIEAQTPTVFPSAEVAISGVTSRVRLPMSKKHAVSTMSLSKNTSPKMPKTWQHFGLLRSISGVETPQSPSHKLASHRYSGRCTPVHRPLAFSSGRGYEAHMNTLINHSSQCSTGSCVTLYPGIERTELPLVVPFTAGSITVRLGSTV